MTFETPLPRWEKSLGHPRLDTGVSNTPNSLFIFSVLISILGSSSIFGFSFTGICSRYQKIGGDEVCKIRLK